MLRRLARSAAPLLITLATLPSAALAQAAPRSDAAALPGRDPRQPIDSAYTAKIHEYTTESFFLSPLVDYLPRSKTVPTPTAVLGDIAGSPRDLPYSTQVYDYMRRLAKASPRVHVYSIGRTEEGREMIAVAVASEALWARMKQNQADLGKLADPRTINFDDAAANRIAVTTAPVYYITGTIHSTEAGAPTALMELAYRLAVDESPYIRNIRDHVITLITPIVEVDGRDRMVDIWHWHRDHPGETAPGVLYWGHYVAHDNNRDAMALTLELSQHVLDTYIGWHAQVLHDLHESVAYLYDNTIGDGPYNAWLDPLLTNEWRMIGWNNVQEMTRFGMPGVFAHGDFDTWSPGYLMFMAATHNGISRLYETFGNGGTPETMERSLSPSETERTWYRQDPPLPRVQWSIRDNNNYEETGLLVSLGYVANNRELFLRNFYQKSKRSIEKPRTEGPAAYAFPADDPHPGAQAELLRVMQKQHVEVSRATAPFTVAVTVGASKQGSAHQARRPSEDSTVGSTPGSSHASRVAAGTGERTAQRTFPVGSYIIRMDQPYSRIADALLDYQYWAPDDPQKNPYDDTGWTFPEGFGTAAVRITDTTVLQVPMTMLAGSEHGGGDGSLPSAGGVVGSTSAELVAIDNDASPALATFRYALPNADMVATEASFDAGGVHFRAGTFIVRGVPVRALDSIARSLRLVAHPLTAAPTVATHPLRAARVAIMHTWDATQTEGWWRQAFDHFRIPHDYVSVQDVARETDLRAKYDVIIFGPGVRGAQSIIDGMPMWRNPMPWKQSAETPNIGTWAQTDDIRPGLGYPGVEHLQQFVKAGGVYVGAGSSADFAIAVGMTNGVSSAQARSRVVGTLLRTRLADSTSPIAYGLTDGLAVYSEDGETFGGRSARGRGGGGGGGGGGGDASQRATGRGSPDDPDVVQGRMALDTSNQAKPRPASVRPWQLGVVTDEQLRNPLNLIPPAQRPRVILHYAAQDALLVSGLLDGGGEIAQRPLVVDSPMGLGHVVLFANNPIYRGETIGSYAMVFNTMLNFDHLDAGRKLADR